MVILHLTSLISGGAGQYTMNIHRQMIAGGYRSYVAVCGKKLILSDGTSVPLYTNNKLYWNKLRRFLFKRYIRLFGRINAQYVGYNLCERFLCHSPKDLLAVMTEKPDVIMVHWVSNFANACYVSELQQLTHAKVYYWMIDEAILSGACHYPWDCTQYQTGCKDCPMTTSRFVKWSIRQNFIYKQKYLVKEKNVILPTEFDKIRLEKSLLWKGCKCYKLIETVDEKVFHPVSDRQKLRTQLGIPQGRKVILFGCSILSEKRKGMYILTEALNNLNRNDCVYVAVGKFDMPSLNKEVLELGYVELSTLSMAYQVADVFVNSSLEDSGPMMVNQSIMCGTPVVAFGIGVALDIVHTGRTGYRANVGDSDDLKNGINYILDMPKEQYEQMRINCHALAMHTYSKQNLNEFVKSLLAI